MKKEASSLKLYDTQRTDFLSNLFIRGCDPISLMMSAAHQTNLRLGGDHGCSPAQVKHPSGFFTDSQRHPYLCQVWCDLGGLYCIDDVKTAWWKRTLLIRCSWYPAAIPGSWLGQSTISTKAISSENYCSMSSSKSRRLVVSTISLMEIICCVFKVMQDDSWLTKVSKTNIMLNRYRI